MYVHGKLLVNLIQFFASCLNLGDRSASAPRLQPGSRWLQFSPFPDALQLGHGLLPRGVDASARGPGERTVRGHPRSSCQRVERQLEEVPLLSHVPQRLVPPLPGVQAGTVLVAMCMWSNQRRALMIGWKLSLPFNANGA